MKRIFVTLTLGCMATGMFAQSAMDAYTFSQPDLRGTARSLGMGGAFGALGNDLSSINNNPAGLGFYRKSELGMTMDWDATKAVSNPNGKSTSNSGFNYSFDNIGGVATIRFFDSALKNFNIGFSYNKAVSFNRNFRGGVGNLKNSVTNYIAGIANNQGLTVADVEATNSYDPYNPTDGGYAADWLAILGYDAYGINPIGDPDKPKWQGQFGNGTTGSAGFSTTETGGVYEYNIALAGNIYDVLYWGMNFDIVNLDYSLNSTWAESLKDAYIFNPLSNAIEQSGSETALTNYYNATGTGFNYQFGVILKPMQELRFGLSFRTPTWYTVNERYSARMEGQYFGEKVTARTNNGYTGENSYNLSTPWRLTASAATVLNNNLIWSNDFEFNFYKGMKFSEATYYNDNYYGDDWDSWSYANSATRSMDDAYGPVNQDVQDYYKTAFTWRTGVEYWLNPNFTLRAGYSYVGSPVEKAASQNDLTIYTSGTIPQYSFDKQTNYLTLGLGYRVDGFYFDFAYVHRNTQSTFHAYTPDPSDPSIPSPQANLSLNNNRFVISTGIKF